MAKSATLTTPWQQPRSIGFPVMFKASAGGGGRGIRVAADETTFERHFHTAQAEAEAAFGSGALYLEHFLNHARHLEVQVLGDGNRVVHCFERECSLQRRRQKVWEEAPSSAIDDATREALCTSACAWPNESAIAALERSNISTMMTTGEFFFIEMNTRIQVEHPVTEMVTGIDLVRAMIQIAQGKPLELAQADVTLRGAAIEVRINAEDPEKQFPALTRPGQHADAACRAGGTRRHHAISRLRRTALLRLAACQDHCSRGNSRICAGAATSRIG